MSIYSLIRPLLFKLDPEVAHKVTLNTLKYFAPFIPTPHIDYPQNIMNLSFPNPIGLAAGLDKNGAYIEPLRRLGFGFIEIGTVTPKPQSGHTKPRVFRLPPQSALINRMGFPNIGAKEVLKNIKNSHKDGILGINIGKNADTLLENAADDYCLNIKKFYDQADYITINISSPNTEGLRSLQNEGYLKSLLETLKNQQSLLAKQHNKYVPLVIKIAPDLEEDEIEFMGKQFLSFEIDGVIATNTTISRKGVEHTAHATEKGGLSGAPLTQQSTQVLQQLYAIFGEKIPLIASGGIMTAEDAIEKLNAGAKLIQLYTGLIYQGPQLIRDIMSAIQKQERVL